MSCPAGSYFLWWDVIEPPVGQCYVMDAYRTPAGELWAERRPITRQEARDMSMSPFQGGRRRL